MSLLLGAAVGWFEHGAWAWAQGWTLGWAQWWSAWSSYRPIDFLMFSPSTYHRLFQAQNLAWWPLHVPLLGLGLAWLAAAVRARATSGAGGDQREVTWLRAAALVLAMVWAFVAWSLLHRRFAPIFWVADIYAAAFVVQACGWLLLAAAGGLRWRQGLARRAGLALGAWALLGHALLAPALGRPWTQAEVFGLAPDPTALASLAFLLLTRARSTWPRRWHRGLWIVALAWCVVSGATLATMALA